ncbi:MAG: ferric reductase-like transmembrane domain-containing protein [Gammaproteobacteria bacterium]|nr:ferric reductase-like transmembrane domain-containing protein [Gammaproteobacteria bacterium]
MSASSRRNWQVFFGALFITGILSVAWLSRVDFIDANMLVPIRHTAQLAFAIYILILVARPLQQLLRKPWTAKLLRNRRLLGVAFAAVMTTHLLLIAMRFGSQPELTYPLGNLLVGAGAYGIFYLMLITSFDGPTKALGRRRWKILHNTGLIWGGIIFGLPRSVADLSDPDYLKLGIPFLLAIVIRFIAWRRSIQRDSSRSPA